MKTLKIQLSDIFVLESEIGKLLNEKLTLSTKYWLIELNKQVLEIKTTIDSLRDELIKTYGTTNADGNIIIPYYCVTLLHIISYFFILYHFQSYLTHILTHIISYCIILHMPPSTLMRPFQYPN